MLKYLSSIFPLSVKIHRMQIPLVDDLKAQKNTIGRFLIKSSVFLVILFLSDQIAGGFLRMGLDRYFGLDVPARILCVGHSHSVLGIDKIALEKRAAHSCFEICPAGSRRFRPVSDDSPLSGGSPQSVRIIAMMWMPMPLRERGSVPTPIACLSLYGYPGHPGVCKKSNSASPGEYWLRNYLKLPRFSEVTLSLSIRGWLRKVDESEVHTNWYWKKQKKQLKARENSGKFHSTPAVKNFWGNYSF